MVNAIPEQCKFCGSRYIVRYGHYKQIQRWWCNDCGRKFVYNEALPRMRTPIIQIASALSMFCEGMSLHGIRRNFEQTYRSSHSNAAIYYWVVRLAKEYKPNVGDTWVADETMLKIEGENLWFWDLEDGETRFSLASHISLTRTTRDAKTLMERAADRAGKTSKVVVTDRLAAYLDGIELAFSADTRHLPAKKLTTSPGTQKLNDFIAL